jgi:D-alanine-D-alanine ligase
MRKRRILVLSHEDHVVPDSLQGLSDQEVHDIKTEWGVVTTLRELGHDVRQLGVREELLPIRRAVRTWKPHLVFNLLEEFQEEAVYDHAIVSYLQLLGVPFTGCGPRGLMLARDKSLAKKLMIYHRVRVPRFFVARLGRKTRLPRRLDFPLIVKSLVEEASIAIAKASVVHSEEKLAERVDFVHQRVGTDAIVEEFIPGREIYVALLGNERLQVLPPQELVIGGLAQGEPLIATERLKHDAAYQRKKEVDLVAPKLSDLQRRRLDRISRRAYRTLELRGYGRLDFRLGEDGEFYFLEANPNPELAESEEVATAALAAGLEYPDFLQKIVSLGLRSRR